MGSTWFDDIVEHYFEIGVGLQVEKSDRNVDFSIQDASFTPDVSDENIAFPCDNTTGCGGDAMTSSLCATSLYNIVLLPTKQQ